MHLAESVEQARKDVEYGIGEWLHYFKRIAPIPISADPGDVSAIIEEFTKRWAWPVIGTPDMAIEKIESLIEQTGGLGVFLIQGHDWASPAATHRSYELFARHVIPRFNGSLRRRLANYDWVLEYVGRREIAFIAAQQKARDEHDAATAGAGRGRFAVSALIMPAADGPRELDRTYPFPRSAAIRAANPIFNDNRLKLGVFGINWVGLAMTNVPGTLVPTWEASLEIGGLPIEPGSRRSCPCRVGRALFPAIPGIDRARRSRRSSGRRRWRCPRGARPCSRPVTWRPSPGTRRKAGGHP